MRDDIKRLIASQAESDRMWSDACDWITESDAGTVAELCDKLESAEPRFEPEELELLMRLAILSIREAAMRISARQEE